MADNHLQFLDIPRRDPDKIPLEARMVEFREIYSQYGDQTAAEQASNHCQLGNIGAVSRLIDSWLDLVAGSFVDGDAPAGTSTPM